MKEELSLREIINEVIIFFINFKTLIIAITLVGTLGIIVFQKIRPAYYNTTSIATSGISAFERIEDKNEVLNQRTAINLINTLQLDIQKEDFIVLAEKLSISKEKAASIKSITATQIFRKDQDGKDFNTPKFEILLSIKDNEIIKDIEEGLLHYFNSNQYIQSYYNYFKITNENEIIAIDNEIESLQKFRLEKGSNIDMSSFNLYSKNGLTEMQNQIIELNQLKSLNATNQMLLKPLSFVKGFTISQAPERGVLLLGSLAFAISFIIAIVVAVFVNVKRKLIIK
tara:strand:+ start:105 stop:956 length:852 start_codon:yes stop_codon:yes gene_type:complete